jgi:cytochrome c-type biogenesis protein CcmF
VNGAFLSFIIFTSNPFLRLLPYFPNDGADLNPLLQDPGLIIHPPMLYMGYVGFSIVFACAIASLCAGRLDSSWARLARPWVLAAWLFLTVGIALGSWWAYYTLGWGGWWFWDPVENASFLPWLTGTALIHSLAVTDMRNTFKGQTVFLAVTTFCLCLLGTFLVRSGVLTSVHAFANDPSRGIFILMLLLFVMGSAWFLYAWRMHHLITKVKFSGVSRESLLLLNSLLLVTACASILLGTLYPLLLEAFGGGLISVGPPYFNAVFIPLAALNILLMGLGPSSQYKSYDFKLCIKRLAPIAFSCIAIALLLPWIMLRKLDLWACFGIGLGLWVIIATLFDALIRSVRRPSAWRKLTARYWGMVFAHVGIGLLVLGVTVVSRYDIEQDIAIAPGQQAKVGAMVVDFIGVRGVRGANFQAMEGKFKINHGENEFLLYPQKRIFNVSGMPVSNADLIPGLFYDIYIAMAEPIDDSGAWAVRIYLKPMVRFIWLGAIFMAIGAFLSMRDRRYRQVKVIRKPAALQMEGV